jgi:hypothetical protein
MKYIATFFDVITALSALMSGFIMLSMFTSAAAAKELNNMELAATSALAATLVIIPYCIAGAFHRQVALSAIDAARKREWE